MRTQAPQPCGNALPMAAADTAHSLTRSVPTITERLAMIIRELTAVTTDLQSLLATTGHSPEAGREEYLSIKGLIARMPYEEQTVRNLMSQGELREGYHYLQRMKHGRIVFVWSRMQQWMRERSNPERREMRDHSEPFYRGEHARTHKAG